MVYIHQGLEDGWVPLSLSQMDLLERDSLLSRMMSDRRSVRLLCAPSLYGKSALAYQYAKILRCSKQIFWVDAQSPCFLFDIDRDELFSRFAGVPPENTVVVFDALPFLDEDRRRTFLEGARLLCESGAECLVTTRDDTLAHDIEGAILIAADELLFLDRRIQGVCSSASVTVERIPVFLGGHSEARERFVESLYRHEVLSEQDLLACLSLVLRGATFDDLQVFFGQDVAALAREVVHDQPHCPVGSSPAELDAFVLSDDEKITLLSKHWDSCVDVSRCSDGEEFRRTLLDVLIHRGEETLASKLVPVIGDKGFRKRFFDTYAERIFLKGEMCCVIDLSQELDFDEPEDFGNILLVARSAALLGDYPRCNQMLETASKCCDTPLSRAMLALTRLCFMMGTVEDNRDMFMANMESVDTPDMWGVEDDVVPPWSRRVDMLGCFVAREYLRDSLSGFHVLEQILSSGLSERESLELIVVYFMLRGIDDDSVSVQGGHPSSEEMAGMLFAVVSREIVSLPPNHFEAQIVCAVDFLYGSSTDDLLPEEFVVRARCAENALRRQTRIWWARHGSHPSFRDEAISSPPSLHLFAPRMFQRPRLFLKTFGGFEMMVKGGGCTLGKVREKARVLLAFLAFNHDRELSRAWLERVMWPDADADNARQSFYNIWSYCRKILSDREGNCPFLESTQSAVRLVGGCVETDVALLEEICNDVVKMRVGEEDYEIVLSRLEEVYRGPLLPGVENAELEACRKACESKILDALIVASEHLQESNRFRLSLRYAQFAFAIDPTREDVCFLLMKIHRLLGQYMTAMTTFIQCRKTLVERFGVEGSKRLETLYREILLEIS